MSARIRYAADLLAANVHLPLSISPECQATIVDATGRDIATIDMNRTRPDAEAVKIAHWLALAVNTCGGTPLFLTGEGSASIVSGDRADG